MNQFNNNRYQNKRRRAYWWNYGWNGSYFVTICAFKRQRFFGEIIRESVGEDSSVQVMELSEIGKIVEGRWIDIPEHFSFVKLGKFIVMPDHFHGILSFDKGVEFNKPPDLHGKTEMLYGYNNWESGILGSVVNQFKRICTLQSREFNPEFKWQPRYYDRIIRNRWEYHRYSKYIIRNPSRYRMLEISVHPVGSPELGEPTGASNRHDEIELKIKTIFNKD